MSLFLGLDLGTQNVKALIYDADQRKVVGAKSSALYLTSHDDGTREQLAEWWLYAMRQAITELDPELRKNVAAMAVSGQQHGFVPLDRQGRTLAPVKLWCDTSTRAECEEITARAGGPQRCLDEAGNLILPGYTAGKIRWLKKNNARAYKRLATILLPHDYINFYLTGERFMEYGDASGTGLLNIRTRRWHEGILAAVDDERDLSECLPPLAEPGRFAGELLAEVAQELGLPKGIRVAPGGGDNMMAAIGTGNVANGRMTVSLGTSATMFTSSDRPVIDGMGDLAAFCSSTGGWLPLLCTMNCTVATEQVRSLFRREVSEMEALLEAVPIGSRGVVTLPFYNGERTPNLPKGKGCILGLDLNNMTEGNLLRSGMEAATYGLRLGLDAFSRVDCELDEIRLTGGGANNPVWRQMVADVLNKPVVTLENDEGAALGAALQAMWVHHGTGDSLEELLDDHLLVDAARCSAPNEKSVARYHDCYEEYQQAVELLKPIYS